MKNEQEYIDTGLSLINHGYSIIPIRDGLKHPGFAGWNTTVIGTNEAHALGADPKYTGWGVKCRDTGAIDADIYDRDIAEHMSKLMPRGSLIRVGRFPKLLYVVRNAEGWTKRASKAYVDADGNTNKVEFLGDGQQFVTYGIHPETGEPYRYHGTSITAVPRADLPAVSESELDKLFTAFEELADKKCQSGEWKAKAERSEAGGNVVQPTAFESLVKAQTPGNFTLAQIKDDLAQLNPSVGNDEWVRVGMALHHQFQGDIDGLDLFNDWSSRGDNYEGWEDCQARWESFHLDGSKNPITWASMHKIANGSRVVAQQSEANASRELFRLSDLKGRAPEVVWMWDKYIPRGEVTLIYADGATGKTQLAVQLAIAQALGRPLFNVPVTQGGTLIISCEDDRDDIHRRVERCEMEWSDSPEALEQVIVYCPGDAKTEGDIDAMKSMLMFFEAGMGKTTPFFNWLERTAKSARVSQITIDTVADVFAGNEIVKSEVRAFIRTLTALAKRLDVAILLLAHPSKSGMSDGTGTSGNVGWNNSARSRLYMTRNEDDTVSLLHKKSNKGPLNPDLLLGNMHGVLRSLTPEEVADLTQVGVVREQFMVLLREITGRNQTVGDSPQGNYAPRLFTREQTRHPDMVRFTVSQYADAMSHLLSAGTIALVENRRNQSRVIVEVEV